MTQSTLAVPKMWELSEYELQRKPQPVITDNIEVAISPRSLHSELMCPICLDMLTNTMTTKECLHRFCHDCIITALRSGNKECPTCRKKLVSKRSLRPDPNFDSLIEKIYPNRDEYEEHQEKVLEKLKTHTNQQALAESIEEGLQLQAQNRLQRMLRQQQRKAEEADKAREGADEGFDEPTGEALPAVESSAPVTTPKLRTGSKRSRPASAASVSSDVADEVGNVSDIEIILNPHPDALAGGTVPPDVRYIKTTGNSTINHFIKYLNMRLCLDNPDTCTDVSTVEEDKKRFSISVIPTGESEYKHLEGELTLDYVNQNLWKENKAINLYFTPVS